LGFAGGLALVEFAPGIGVILVARDRCLTQGDDMDGGVECAVAEPGESGPGLVGAEDGVRRATSPVNDIRDKRRTAEKFAEPPLP